MLSFLSRFLRASHTAPTQTQTARAAGRPRLGMELLEDRSVPSVSAAINANGTLLLDQPTAAGEVVTFSIVGANLRVTSASATGITNAGGMTVVNANNMDVASASVQRIIINGSATNIVGIGSAALAAAINNAGMANMKELSITAPTTTTVDMSTLTRAVYGTYNLAGGASQLTLPATGVSVVKFTARTAASSLTVNTGTVTTGQVALDFRTAVAAAGAGVNANLLTTSVGGYGAGATSQAITVTDPTKVTGVYGSIGNDNITGNNAGNLLIGGEGTDKVLGGTGDDEIYGTFSPIPAYGGTVGTQGSVPFVTFTGAATDPIIDLAKVPTLNTQFQAAATANSFTPQSIANTLKYTAFNFGSGVSFIPASTISPATLTAEITNATNYATAQQGATDLLFGDAGNNSMFGFAKTSVVANGTTGNNVGSAFSTSFSNTWQFGSGSSTYTLAFGDVANIATNNPAANGSNKVFFVGGTPSAPTFVSIGGIGTNEVNLDNGAKQVSVNTGSSKTTIKGGANDGSNIITLNAGSSIAAGLTNVKSISNTLS